LGAQDVDDDFLAEEDFGDLTWEEIDAMLFEDLAEPLAFERGHALLPAVYVGSGYDTNVLASPLNVQQAAFGLIEVDLIASWLPDRRQPFSAEAYVLASWLRYDDVPDVDDEVFALAVGSLGWALPGAQTLNLEATVGWFDQVYDLTFDSLEPETATFQVLQADVSPEWLWSLPDRSLEIGLELIAGHAWYQTSEDDYTDLGGRLTLAHLPARGPHVELSLGYRERDFEDREARSATGFSLADEPLRYREWRAELDVSDTLVIFGRTFEIALELDGRQRRDNAVGYDDLRRYEIEAEVETALPGGFELGLEAALIRQEWPKQEGDLDGSIREQELIETRVALERNLGWDLLGSLRWRWQRSTANRMLDRWSGHRLTFQIERGF
jgi:hypothetical protein